MFTKIHSNTLHSNLAKQHHFTILILIFKNVNKFKGSHHV